MQITRNSPGRAVPSVARALDALLNDRDTPLAEIVDRHFTPDYRQRTDGSWDDRAGFVRHIEHLRSLVRRASVTVLDELVDGDTYAERHVVEVDKVDGSRAAHEVYVFAQITADGRFSRLEEATVLLAGSGRDAELGRAR
ncbi:nuclear transport factor 2 family protein [Rhodococcus triatomae]|uniref:nuclear transport factor 2 family protein n=1 Tax=Rhodococcus triatomae TaxID=300028 RepID=UPI001C316907|nr:nuclear transport factor 2 family protein [Rhodococcus triatomae]